MQINSFFYCMTDTLGTAMAVYFQNMTGQRSAPRDAVTLSSVRYNHGSLVILASNLI